jgi:CBS domain-containing protein
MKGKVIHAIPIISNPMNTPQAEITIRGIITAIDISKEVDSNATVEDIMTSSSVHIDSSA